MSPRPDIGRAAQSGGQSLVEFALILPLVLVLTLGIVDAARVFASWIALNGGVSEASLYASNSVKITHWCMKPADAPPGSIACPTGTAPGQVDTACALIAGDPTGNWCPNPDNIAYRLRVEASGLDASRLIMAPPTCAKDAASGGGPIACADPSAAYVIIGASYDVDLLTPLVSSFMGHPVHMSAAAWAPIVAP